MRFTDTFLRKLEQSYNTFLYATRRRMKIIFSGEDIPSQKPRLLHQLGYNKIRTFAKALDSKATISGVSDTNSMDPAIDYGHTVILIDKPKREDLQVGDVILFHRRLDDSPRVLHRIVEIGDDGEWYCFTCGDNTVWVDGYIRYEDIHGLLGGVIY